MTKTALTALLAISGTALALPSGNEPALATDSTATFRSGAWGLGVRPLGTATAILAYRTLAPEWTAALRLNWSSSNSDHDMPSGSSTTVTTYDYTVTKDTTITTSTTAMDTETVTRNHSFTAILGPEYERPLARNVDFKADVGLVTSWSWSTNQQWITNGTTTSTSYSSTWSLNGGVSGSAGFRWWFIPHHLALAGEFEARLTGGYTGAKASSSSFTTTNTSSYVSTVAKSTPIHSDTWNLSTTTYTGALGVDVFF